MLASASSIALDGIVVEGERGWRLIVVRGCEEDGYR